MGKIHSSADMVCLCKISGVCTEEKLLPSGIHAVIMFTRGRDTDMERVNQHSACANDGDERNMFCVAYY